MGKTDSTVFQRIEELCQENEISIHKLETSLGFTTSTIRSWKKAESLSIDKLIKIANFFNVSIDYLTGKTDLRISAADALEDEDIITLQRARENMTPQDRERFMKLVKAGFDYAFKEDDI